MTQWATFAGLVGVVLLLLLGLSRLTERSLTPVDEVEATADATERTSDPDVSVESDAAGETTDVDATDSSVDPHAADATTDADAAEPSTGPHAEDATTDVDAAEPPTDPHTADATTDVDSADASVDPDETSADTPAEYDDRGTEPTPPVETDSDHIPVRGPAAAGSTDVPAARRDDDAAAYVDGQPVTTAALLANVVVTQGLFLAILVGAAIYTDVPASALGIDLSAAWFQTGLVVGALLGVGLYVANELGAGVASRLGIDHDEALREMLAPDSGGGWALLLLVALPLIAVFEELLFRAILVGALATGFGLDPWLLAIGSSIAFAVGHGVQGTAGVVVTGLLGFVLAALFVLTWNLWLVIVAHYVINALEFVVHEGLGVEWADAVVGVETKS